MQQPLSNKIEIGTDDSYDLINQSLKPKEIFSQIAFYFLPILSLLVFMTILFSAVIPNVSVLFGKLEDIDKLKNQDKTLNVRIQNLILLREQNNQQQEIIDKINFIVPTGKTEVVKFSDRIAATTTKNSLKLDGIKTGEATLTRAAADQNMLKISQIPIEFNISGDFNNFRTFLNGLYTGQDFFVVEKMSLTAGEGTTWNGGLSLVKYQFNTGEGFNPIITYGSISESLQPNQAVIDFLNHKFVNNPIEGE